MRCIDTDLLVAILRGKEEAKAKMQEIDSKERSSTTSVNAFEIFYGAYRSKRGKNIEATERLLERLDVIPLDMDTSQRAGEIAANLASKGETIDYRDAMIAGIALVKGLTLVTRNVAHFSRIRNLKLEPW